MSVYVYIYVSNPPPPSLSHIAKHGMMWSAAEDDLLLKYVGSFGYKNIPWCKINANVIPGRHAMSCESRWRKYLKMKNIF